LLFQIRFLLLVGMNYLSGSPSHVTSMVGTSEDWFIFAVSYPKLEVTDFHV